MTFEELDMNNEKKSRDIEWEVYQLMCANCENAHYCHNACENCEEYDDEVNRLYDELESENE